jgi:hypothetical protein
MYKYNGRIIPVNRGWTDDNGVQHPRQWSTGWSEEEKTAYGLVWEDDPAPYDSRFYSGRDDEGNLVAKSLDDLKSNAKEQVKFQAGILIAPTDWMVIKASEVGDYTVPADVLTYRAAVRTASNTIEAAITACTDLASFMALYDVPVNADGNPTGNAPINDFPEADS